MSLQRAPANRDGAESIQWEPLVGDKRPKFLVPCLSLGQYSFEAGVAANGINERVDEHERMREEAVIHGFLEWRESPRHRRRHGTGAAP